MKGGEPGLIANSKGAPRCAPAPGAARGSVLPAPASLTPASLPSEPLAFAPPSGGSYATVPSASRPLGRRSALFAGGVLVALGAALTALPAALAWPFLAALLWLQAALKGVAALARPRCAAAGAPELTVWPHYTVLVPLFREADGIDRLLRHLDALDYPRSKLEVVLICEPHDAPTRAALRRPLPEGFRVAVAPAQGPQTKPKALTAILPTTRGEIVTIYDAEDAPHPQQLKAAARAFAADPRLVALQAPLEVDNAHPAWVSRQFALEYAALFHVWLPWLCRLGLPVPLGGTSNHVRRDALDAVGGWDAFNVTEDADLAFRLALEPGARFGWLGYPTMEEAVAGFRAWCPQRTRWLKGFMQTWLGHATCGTGWRQGGWRRAVSLHVTVGLTLLSTLLHGLLLPVIVAASVAGFASSPALITAGGLLYASGLAGLAVGARRARIRLSLRDAVLAPLYWLMLTVPAWLAVRELVLRPHHWNKTAHNVAERRDAAPWAAG